MMEFEECVSANYASLLSILDPAWLSLLPLCIYNILVYIYSVNSYDLKKVTLYMYVHIHLHVYPILCLLIVVFQGLFFCLTQVESVSISSGKELNML